MSLINKLRKFEELKLRVKNRRQYLVQHASPEGKKIMDPKNRNQTIEEYCRDPKNRNKTLKDYCDDGYIIPPKNVKMSFNKQNKKRKKKMKENQIVVSDMEKEQVFILVPGIGKKDLMVKVNIEKNIIVMKVNKPKDISKKLLECVEIDESIKIEVGEDYSAENAEVTVKNGVIMVVSPVKNTIKTVTVG